MITLSFEINSDIGTVTYVVAPEDVETRKADLERLGFTVEVSDD